MKEKKTIIVNVDFVSDNEINSAKAITLSEIIISKL